MTFKFNQNDPTAQKINFDL